MRCIFCRLSSVSSKSVEHVIPESLGNKRHVLPRGVVCDVCNNYFSRKVEKPFLDLPAVRQLRFYQALESKRGTVPPMDGVIAPDIPALLTRYPKHDFTSIQVPEPALPRILHAGQGTLLFPMADSLPETPVVTRFVAKIALEAMALRLVKYAEGLSYICDEVQLDDLRNHARNGRINSWPIHIRTIYSPNGKVHGVNGELEQIVHEFDFLVTERSEWYFVMVLFGVEFVINLGGPEIGGYLHWLEQNNGISPLYTEKYGGIMAIPR